MTFVDPPGPLNPCRSTRAGPRRMGLTLRFAQPTPAVGPPTGGVVSPPTRLPRALLVGFVLPVHTFDIGVHGTHIPQPDGAGPFRSVPSTHASDSGRVPRARACGFRSAHAQIRPGAGLGRPGSRQDVHRAHAGVTARGRPASVGAGCQDVRPNHGPQ